MRVALACILRKTAALSHLPRPMPTDWILLVLAGLLETAWPVGLQRSQGFTRLWPSIWTLVAIAASVGLLGLAMRSLPAGTAYAVWAGIGVTGTALLDILVLGQPFSWNKGAFIALILVGVMGLKAQTPSA